MDERKKVLDFLWNNGIIATPDLMEKIMKNGGLSYAQELIKKDDSRISNYEILKSRDIFEASAGKSESFRKLFQDRYIKIKKILQARVSVSSPVDIEYARISEGEATIIAMVMDVRESKYGKVLEIEDLSGSAIAYADINTGGNVLPDDIIAIRVNVKNGRFYVKDITYPGVDNAQKKEKLVDSENAIAFISDTHVGSKMFMEESFNKFIEWLNNDGNGKKVKYLVVSGDLVDGIGIYPGQEKDLELDDIYDQYGKLSSFFEKIRNDVTIFLSPGNHDLVRISEPQPALSSDIRKIFQENVVFVSNPAYVSIEGVKILIYHGASLNDFMDLMKGMKYDNAIKMMEEILKRRHLSPFYGRNVPIAPTIEDFMVIDEIPDIFVTGHIHVHKYSNYFGILLLNASAWQKQTDYQKMHNFVPDPAKVTLKFLNKPGFTVLDFK
ncbi:MAG: DNA-directed DNA polymerase II small subunit [Thermoplasmata archaeon]